MDADTSRDSAQETSNDASGERVTDAPPANAFSWQIPTLYNIGVDVCDKWADGSNRLALIHESADGSHVRLTFDVLKRLSNQLANEWRANGVKAGELELREDAVRDIVRYYTREAGVRSLERELSKICRKVVKNIQLGKAQAPVQVTADNLPDYLGVRKFTYGHAEQKNQVGQVVGLAWTEVGGDLLTIEAAAMPGKGVINRTGSLGDVMKESVEAARTVVRSRARSLGIRDDVFEKRDIHIHVPDGATPKDGPSAGAAMTTALVSVLTGIPVRADVAMTGEITLRGEVTAIGGLKEKLLAALRGGIKTVMIPEENVKDLAEIPDNVKSGLEIVPVRWIDKVLEVALETTPAPLSDSDAPAAEPVPVVPAAAVAATAAKAAPARRSRAVKH